MHSYTALFTRTIMTCVLSCAALVVNTQSGQAAAVIDWVDGASAAVGYRTVNDLTPDPFGGSAMIVTGSPYIFNPPLGGSALRIYDPAGAQLGTVNTPAIGGVSNELHKVARAYNGKFYAMHVLTNTGPAAITAGAWGAAGAVPLAPAQPVTTLSIFSPNGTYAQSVAFNPVVPCAAPAVPCMRFEPIAVFANITNNNPIIVANLDSLGALPPAGIEINPNGPAANSTIINNSGGGVSTLLVAEYDHNTGQLVNSYTAQNIRVTAAAISELTRELYILASPDVTFPNMPFTPSAGTFSAEPPNSFGIILKLEHILYSLTAVNYLTYVPNLAAGFGMYVDDIAVNSTTNEVLVSGRFNLAFDANAVGTAYAVPYTAPVLIAGGGGTNGFVVSYDSALQPQQDKSYRYPNEFVSGVHIGVNVCGEALATVEHSLFFPIGVPQTNSLSLDVLDSSLNSIGTPLTVALGATADLDVREVTSAQFISGDFYVGTDFYDLTGVNPSTPQIIGASSTTCP